MKLLKYISSVVLGFAIVFISQSCRDTKAAPLPVFETAVHGFGDIAAVKNLAGKSVADTFAVSNLAKSVPFTWRWISIDNINTVNKVEYFVTLREPYDDVQGNPRTANHGTKAYKTLDGSAAPANRAFISATIKPEEIYALYKDATFNYGKGAGAKKVFEQNGRTAAAPWNYDDYVTLTWVLTTADGRKFTEWSTAVCGETVGANCQLEIYFQ
jgi:hypothetical protein